MATKEHVFTLGIEEEFQLIDPATRELRSHIREIIAGGKGLLKEHLKAEMHQSIVELGTGICSDARCAREEVIQLRSELATLAEGEGLKIASAGTHPFSHWMDQNYPRRLIDENRWRAGRYGLDGKLIDFGRKREMEERELLHEMLEFVAAEVEELGNEREMAHLERIMREGTGADRQLTVWERTHDIKAVVDHIVAETYEGLSLIAR